MVRALMQTSLGLGAVNLFTPNQSSVEVDTTGFASLAGATITRDTAQFVDGVASLKVVTPGIGVGEGPTTLAGLDGVPVVPSVSYVASVSVMGAVATPVVLRIEFYTVAGAAISHTDFAFTLPVGTWARFSVTMMAPATAFYSAMSVQTTGIAAATFWLDCLQIAQTTTLGAWVLGPAWGPVTIETINTKEAFDAILRRLPSVGVGFEGRKFEARRTTVNGKRQNCDRSWIVYYAGAGPYPGLAAGTDVFSLMETGADALMGLEVTVGTAHRILRAVDEAILIEKLPAGGLLYAQRWSYWQAG
jgi:hypothetical protein